MRRKTPVRALLEGLIAGTVGSAVQSLFFRITERVAPSPPKDVFTPAEPQQANETALQTVARRLAEGLAARGPLDDEAKERVGTLLHYGFGAAWGGLYGLVRASYPRAWSSTGLAGFSLAVWMISDNLVLPALKLAAPPQRYPLRVHAYAATAHLAYGAGVAASLVVADHAELLPLAGYVLLSRAQRTIARGAGRSQALVPRDLIEGSRHFAAAIARRARDAVRH
ncbi:MAG: hypothetical protein JWM53_3273 [bacterium]|nr:hypothetical protein [bacterium]